MNDEEISNFHSLPKIIRVKPRRMRWVGYVACMGG
jgi:hypothetical protein